ncbi:MAG TPA: hypothetical protein VFE62_01585 [Gemmataceae bacterium]|nr:hypothetical protein [Gemmataceae bacterium]
MTISQIPIACDWQELTVSGKGTVNFNLPTFTKAFATYGWTSESDAVGRAETYFASNPTINVNGVVLFLYDYQVEPTDGLLWIVTATYKFQVDYFELSFDTSGGTRKIYHALDEGSYYSCTGLGSPTDRTPAGQGFVSFNRLIGVSGDQVEGCETPLPDKFDFTVLVRSKFSTMPSGWIDKVRRLTGHTNDAPLTISWKDQDFDFDTEELLFLGMPGKMTSDDDLELTWKFSAQRGRKGGMLLTADFVQQDDGDSVNIEVQSTSGITISQQLYIEAAGLYLVTAIVDDTHLTVEKLTDFFGTFLDPGATVTLGNFVSFDVDGSEPIIIGGSGPIAKPGWRYLWTHSRPQMVGGTIFDGRIAGGRNIPQPVIAVVNKVIPTADLSILGIFS